MNHRDKKKRAGKKHPAARREKLPSVEEVTMLLLDSWPEALDPLRDVPVTVRPVAMAAAVHGYALLTARTVFGGELGPDDDAFIRDADKDTTDFACEIAKEIQKTGIAMPATMAFAVAKPPPEFRVSEDEFTFYDDPPEDTPIPSWVEDEAIVSAIGESADALSLSSERRVARYLDNPERAVTAMLVEFSAALALSKLALWQLDQKVEAPLAESLAIEISEALMEAALGSEGGEADDEGS